MDNMNQLKLVDLKLNDAIQKIIDVDPDAIFIVDGDVFCGTLKLIQGIDEDNFIYVTDTMNIGEVHSSILSEEFIALRVKTLSNLSGVPYDIEYKRYEQFVSKLRKMTKRSGVNIYFIQSNYYISQIWQLTMQAYIEQIGTGKHIKRLCVDESFDCISNFDDIAISGSYNAYCKLMCCRTPVQYPIDGTNRKVTHFEYNYLQDILLKINLLTHNSFSILYKLENATGVKANEIPLDDKETMELIKCCDVDGIREFEHESAKEMIKKIKPQKFDDLIKISGLLHGAGILKDNGEELFDAGIDFSKLPAFRDDIMLALMEYGVEREKAFMISEKVWKGKGLQEWEYGELLDMNVPEWFLNLCDNIKYLFPKAHAADYVRTAFILAYYKAHFRTEFEIFVEEYTEGQ